MCKYKPVAGRLRAGVKNKRSADLRVSFVRCLVWLTGCVVAVYGIGFSVVGIYQCHLSFGFECVLWWTGVGGVWCETIAGSWDCTVTVSGRHRYRQRPPGRTTADCRSGLRIYTQMITVSLPDISTLNNNNETNMHLLALIVEYHKLKIIMSSIIYKITNSYVFDYVERLIFKYMQMSNGR